MHALGSCRTRDLIEISELPPLRHSCRILIYVVVEERMSVPSH